MINTFSRSAMASLCLVVLAGGGARGAASPYYTVTDLGLHSTLSYPISGEFSGTYDPSKLPKEQGLQGASNPETVTFDSRVWAVNKQGNIIAALPDGGSRGLPYFSLKFAYYKVQSDGYYQQTPFGANPDFGPDASNFHGYTSFPILNAKNQILYNNQLWDTNKNTQSDLSSLVSSEILSRFRDGSFRGVSLLDDGSLVATGYDADGVHTLILTPPGQPVPTPEPTTLAILAAGLVGAVVCRFRNHARGR